MNEGTVLPAGKVIRQIFLQGNIAAEEKQLYVVAVASKINTGSKNSVSLIAL